LYRLRLEDLRRDHDMTQQQVAELLHCQREVYRRYEKGEREIPIWALHILADHYKTSIDYILGRTDNPYPYEPRRSRPLIFYGNPQEF